jgi:hypothetical protein
MEEDPESKAQSRNHYVFKVTSEIPWFFGFELSKLEYETPIPKGEMIKRRWEVGRLHSTDETG